MNVASTNQENTRVQGMAILIPEKINNAIIRITSGNYVFERNLVEILESGYRYTYNFQISLSGTYELYLEGVEIGDWVDGNDPNAPEIPLQPNEVWAVSKNNVEVGAEGQVYMPSLIFSQ